MLRARENDSWLPVRPKRSIELATSKCDRKAETLKKELREILNKLKKKKVRRRREKRRYKREQEYCRD